MLLLLQNYKPAHVDILFCQCELDAWLIISTVTKAKFVIKKTMPTGVKTHTVELVLLLSKPLITFFSVTDNI